MEEDIHNKLLVQVSVVIPVHNASAFLDEAFQSIVDQTWTESLEVSIFNDASNDGSEGIITRWLPIFHEKGIGAMFSVNESGAPAGVGAAKNAAIRQSHGRYICFLDADDVMLPRRVELQLAAVRDAGNAIVGARYRRTPEGSTERYTAWANGLTPEQLYTQAFTAFGPTLINPTWMLARETFENVGGFKEGERGFPEDLDFFYRHLRLDGRLRRVEECLLVYRYHESAASFGVHEDTIWKLRVSELEARVLNSWQNFTIWNAGKQGRKLYRSLSSECRGKVTAMCDVAENRIAKQFYTCELMRDSDGGIPRIPVVHFREARGPFVICVKLDLTGGAFEANLAELNLIEGVDYFHFS